MSEQSTVPVSRERVAELRMRAKEYLDAEKSRDGLITREFAGAASRLFEPLLESFPALLDRAEAANRLERENAKLRGAIHDAVFAEDMSPLLDALENISEPRIAVKEAP